jgi:hypothetical protein
VPFFQTDLCAPRVDQVPIVVVEQVALPVDVVLA